MPYKNIEDKRECGRRYYQKYREQITVKHRENWRKNRDRYNQTAKIYRATHKDQIKRKNQRYGQLSYVKAKNVEKTRRYEERHPQKVMEFWKRWNGNLGLMLGLNAIEYKAALMKWGKFVKNAYENMCAVCGSDKYLEAHHLISRAKYPELSLNLNNGIALCKQHHREVEGKRFRSGG